MALELELESPLDVMSRLVDLPQPFRDYIDDARGQEVDLVGSGAQNINLLSALGAAQMIWVQDSPHLKEELKVDLSQRPVRRRPRPCPPPARARSSKSLVEVEVARRRPTARTRRRASTRS